MRRGITTFFEECRLIRTSFAVGRQLALGSIMLTILLIVLVIALLGGGLGHSRYGYAGWSPAGIILVVLLIWLFMGHRI